MPYATSADGTRIHYESAGAGPPVVLLHGMGGTYARGWRDTGWEAWLTGAGYRVIGLDGRGLGQSDRLTDPARFRDGVAVADVGAVLDACAVERAHVIGYSMGAGQALRLGLERPARVRSLVLGGLGGIAMAFAGLFVDSAPHSRARLTAGQQLVGRGLEARDPALVPYDAAYFQALHEDSLTAGDLEGMALPVLIVVGDGDTAQGDFAALPVSELLERRIPGARRLVLTGVDHQTCVPDPRFHNAALAFLRGLA